MSYPIDSDWIYGIPYSAESGFIENRGDLVFPYAKSLELRGNQVIATRPSGLLFLSLANKDPQIPNLNVRGLDSNVNWNPKKYYIGKYTVSIGNFVLEDGTIDFVRQLLTFSPQNNLIFQILTLQGNALYTSPQAFFRAWMSRDPLAISELVATNPDGVSYYFYGANLKFSYELKNNVYLKYEWF